MANLQDMTLLELQDKLLRMSPSELEDTLPKLSLSKLVELKEHFNKTFRQLIEAQHRHDLSNEEIAACTRDREAAGKTLAYVKLAIGRHPDQEEIHPPFFSGRRGW
jgi:hypothetical protein